MEKFIRFSLFLICLFLISLTVCKYAQAEDLKEYYPLSRQSIWKYEISTADDVAEIEEIKIGGEENIDGQKVIRINYGQGECCDLVAVDPEGVKLYKTADVDGWHIVYRPALLVFPSILEPTKMNKKEYAFLEYDGENNLVRKGSLVLEIEFLGKEDIAVPAGVFLDCIKVIRTITRQTKNKDIYKDKEIIWLGKDIGIVRKLRTAIEYDAETGTVDSDSEVQVLKTAVIENRVYGKRD